MGIEKLVDYDHVGKYTQDSINGLTDGIIDQMLDLIQPQSGMQVLDAMGGDGNLILRFYEYCQRKKIVFPHCTLLEISRVQLEFAKHRMANINASYIWGDILNFVFVKDNQPLEENVYDRIMIKSANHEISKDDQLTLYKNIYRLLKPGGMVINLGFLFDDNRERDEFSSIARVKDKCAGMIGAMERRYFITREELYSWIKTAGFSTAPKGIPFEYKIRSEIVAEQYFDAEGRLDADMEHQTAQLRAVLLRKRGRISFTYEESMMRLPGEITVMKKPNKEEMVYDKALSCIDSRDNVLEIRCGSGVFAERLSNHVGKYVGIDTIKSEIDFCKEKYSGQHHMSFSLQDINEIDLEEHDFDVITLINTLHLSHVKPLFVLRRIYNLLNPGSCVVVTSPSSSESYCITGQESQRNNYWSGEGMVELLRNVGFKKIKDYDNSLCDDQYYCVVAEK